MRLFLIVSLLKGIRFIVVSLHSHFTAYLGIHESHPLAGESYDNLNIDCHGGLTFSGEGNESIRPKGFYWYGWDYAHCGDLTFFGIGDIDNILMNDKDWTLQEVIDDSCSAIYTFKKLMTLSENIQKKGVMLKQREVIK